MEELQPDWNRLRTDRLTPENKAYYDKIEGYFSEHVVRESLVQPFLLDVSNQMLAGQKEGQSAQQLFGKSHRAFARKKLVRIRISQLNQVDVGLLFVIIGAFFLYEAFANYKLIPIFGKKVEITSASEIVINMYIFYRGAQTILRIVKRKRYQISDYFHIAFVFVKYIPLMLVANFVMAVIFPNEHKFTISSSGYITLGGFLVIFGIVLYFYTRKKQKNDQNANHS